MCYGLISKIEYMLAGRIPTSHLQDLGIYHRRLMMD